jgi:aminopeptidase N
MNVNLAMKCLIICVCLGMPLSLAQAGGISDDPNRIVLPVSATPSHYDLDVTVDPGSTGFSGRESVDLTVNRPTRHLVLNAANLDIKGFTVRSIRAGSAVIQGASQDVALDAQRQTLTLNVPAPLAVGAYTLIIEYTGKVNDSFAGLFRAPYDTPQGRKVALFTQFENSDARRVFPCWDEPAIKATFGLSMTVPTADMVVSNMPIVSTQTLPNGRKHVAFAKTPRMSTYLLFFAAGDFERIARTVMGVDVGVVVKRGDAAKARYALDAAAQILPFYEQYFGVKYPLPKLDLVAGPGQSQFFTAMENWGAIFYLESTLENDPALSTESDRQYTYNTVAHEMAHQWFGDLVTMQWWDELWLNEGFATWMAGKVTAHFHPEWHTEQHDLRNREVALVRDARRGTHPIIQPIRDVLQANDAFDAITYDKGFAVISMLEAYVGSDAFQAGVREYIRKHAYGNTVSDNLWTELDHTSSEPISRIAHDFTLQAGVPLIKVLDTGVALELQEDRFAVDASGSKWTDWYIPVVAGTLGAESAWHGIVSRQHPADIKASGAGAFVVNLSRTGYFRTLYAPALLQSLAGHFGELAPIDEAGLLCDTHALGLAGREPLTDFLDVAQRILPQSNPAVLKLISNQLRDLDMRFEALPGQPRFRHYVSELLSPIFAAAGWDQHPGESADVRLLRSSLLATLSQLADSRVVADARTRFERMRKDPKSLTGDQRQSVLSAVAENADFLVWEQLHEMAKRASSFLEKQQIYGVLGATRDRALAQRALDLVLTDEAPITLRPSIIDAVADGHFPDLAFEFTAAHFKQVDALLEPDSRFFYAPSLLLQSGDLAMVAKLRAYAEARIPVTARKEVVVAEASISYNAAIRAHRLPELDAWLTSHVGASPTSAQN